MNQLALRFAPSAAPVLHLGDVREVLRSMPAESVQCCVTSPPYWGLRDYGVAGQIGLEKTPEEYVATMVEVLREVRRVLRSDGTLWLNLGDSYANDGKWGGATSGLHAKGLHGSTGIGRGKKTTGLKPKDLVGIPWRVAFALQADGWWLRSEIIWAKPNPMPESVTDRPTKAHEQLFLLAKSQKYFYNAEAIKEPLKHPADSTAEDLARAFSRRRAVAPENRQASAKLAGSTPATRNKRSVWTIAPQPFKEAHFATFPPRLVEPCVLAGSRPGDVVMDPFNGAGTTGVVALQHGRRYVGIELSPEYLEITKRRLGALP